ncbi:MAG: PH domain-containing protein [Acidobacteria bacterium]|nr:PH domain-containing protein [Acidobacteriota bacterium]
MGILSRLLGHASEVDIADVEQNLEQILAEGEKVERAFALVRDLFIFTDRRFIMVDKQGITGAKTEYHSIPYKAISHFSVETAGVIDIESELKIWVSGATSPIQKTFRRGKAIYEVQQALATFCK